MTTIIDQAVFDRDEFVQSMIETIDFVGWDHDIDGCDITPDGLHSSVIPTLRTIADAFFTYIHGNPLHCYRGAGYTLAEMLAHDLVLTIQGHGAGFWDGDYESSESSQKERDFVESLTNWCHTQSLETCVGDDGLAYVYGVSQ